MFREKAGFDTRSAAARAIRLTLPGVASLLLSMGAVAAPAHCIGPSAASPRSEVGSQLAAIAPRVMQWAELQAAAAIKSGTPLAERYAAAAREAGVRDPGRIRIVLVDEIPLPDEPLLRNAAAKVGLAQSSAAGLTLGYAVVVRRGYEANLRLLTHELRHVAQYEACGGIRPFLAHHLAHLAAFGYEDSPFEVDARDHEQERL